MNNLISLTKSGFAASVATINLYLRHVWSVDWYRVYSFAVCMLYNVEVWNVDWYYLFSTVWLMAATILSLLLDIKVCQ